VHPIDRPLRASQATSAFIATGPHLHKAEAMVASYGREQWPVVRRCAVRCYAMLLLCVIRYATLAIC
jgi:hypothetical protein